jgi:radical SAM superfamily enzyme YgiQ (UPF0313 family)
MTREAGINPSGSFMFGFIGETRETVKETIDFYEKSDLEPLHELFFTTAFPGTVLYQKAKEMGLIKDDLEYVKRLGEMDEELRLNFTNLSDKELIELKREADRKIRESYMRRHRLWYYKRLLEKMVYYRHYYGTVSLVRRAFGKIRSGQSFSPV